MTSSPSFLTLSSTSAPSTPPLFTSQTQDWNPSPDQENALNTLLAALETPQSVSILSGSAGCGKTTVCNALLGRLNPEVWDVLLLAPTWRAANRLAQVTRQPASSVHSAVYGAPVTERLCPCGVWSAALTKPEPVPVQTEGVEVLLLRYTCPACATAHEDATRFAERLEFRLNERGGEISGKANRLVIVDEAGMISGRVREDIERALLNESSRILFVGDPCQLGPVQEEADGPAGVDLLNPTAALTVVHRQAGDSPVLRLAEPLKVFPERPFPEWPFPRQVRGIGIQNGVSLVVAAQWAAGLRQRGVSVALIALSNQTRARLNGLVREATGAAPYARQMRLSYIPGDRLLARTNGRVRNGELWCIVSFHPVRGAMLNDAGRFPRQKPNYEHDRILAGGVGVFRAELALVGSESVRVSVLLVTPLDAYGAPLLESRMIREGEAPGAARDRMRRIASAWAAEYDQGVKSRQAEFERVSAEAKDRKIAGARFLRAAERQDREEMIRLLPRLQKGGGPDAKERSLQVAAKLRHGALPGAGEAEDLIRSFCLPQDVALDCGDVQEYCRKVYEALDPSDVAVMDEGECLTCHAMQGDQAENVGVVVDGAFWGLWRNERKGGMRWLYTAVTRAEKSLSIFGIKKDGL